MDGPNRMVPVTGSGVCIPGRMQAGRDGKGVTLSSFTLSCPVGASWGRVAPRRFSGAVLLYTGDPHGSGGRMGSQQGGMRDPRRGVPALSPTLGMSSRRVSAARLLPGSRTCPGTPNLAHVPSLFAPIFPNSAPG